MKPGEGKPVLVHPLLSTRPTGMGVAAAEIARMLVPGIADPAPRCDRLFSWINDRVPFGILRMLLRVTVVQIVPLAIPGRRLIFTSHHAPLWRTGRHAVVVYDIIALKHPGQARAQTHYYRRMLPRVIGCAERLVTISHEARSDVERMFPCVDGRPIEVIPTTSRRIEALSGAGRPWSERMAEGTLAFIGARYAHKNLDLAIRALLEWPDRGASQRPCLVVTSCRRDLWPELEKLEQAGVVSVIEYATDLEVDELLARALALIFVSLDEGQGLPPLEAMAAGCPVICSDIPVLRETCGDAAWYVDPGDAGALGVLLRRMRSGELDEEIEEKRDAGRVRAAQFRASAIRPMWIGFLGRWR